MAVSVLPRLLVLLSACLLHASCFGQEPGTGPEVAAKPVDLPELKLDVLATGLKQPLFARAAPGQPKHLYILEKAGVIRVLDLAKRQLLPTPFLDFTAKINTRSERGLLGIAFDREYAQNGIFYVHYNNNDGDTILSRLRVDPAKPLELLADSEEILLQVKQPFANHDGGELSFGPDGMLYLGLGDGGAAADPENNGQKPESLLGKILRLDVSGGPGSPYKIPEDNPFVGDDRFRAEVWAWGLRNPWRFSFDRVTGDLWIGDVGQNKWEEINFAPATSKGGENYGWRIREAAHPFNNDDPKPEGPMIDPIHEYRQGGPLNAKSVTGGYVYRGRAIPALRGWYVFGDYVSGQIWAIRQENGERTGYIDLTESLAGKAGAPAMPSLASFGEDALGELYVMNLAGGTIAKIVAE